MEQSYHWIDSGKPFPVATLYPDRSDRSWDWAADKRVCRGFFPARHSKNRL